MNPLPPLAAVANLASPPPQRRLTPLPAVLLLCATLYGQDAPAMAKPPRPLPGGLGLQPVITDLVRTNDRVTLRWFGLQGPFQVQGSTLAAGPWQNLASPTFQSELTVPATADIGFFQVLSGTPTPLGGTLNYVGAQVCLDCHSATHATWQLSKHAAALDTLATIGQSANATCLPCHTVGYGTPLGFKTAAATPHLAGVQCENCHGPGGSHVANVEDPALRPTVTIASEVCGGCHNGFHHPTFDEWQSSKHAHVEAGVAASILQTGESRMLACGACHSGAVRHSLEQRLDHPAAPLPSREDAAYFGIGCSTCHASHGPTPHPAQLRYPTFSTENFSYSTSSATSFAAQHQPGIQICGQCHNMRGARWQDTSRPPHHSPQYNLLIGQGGHDLGQPFLASHGGAIQKQCAHCHTHPHTPDPVTAANPKYTGHAFEVRYQGCVSTDPTVACHSTVSRARNWQTRTQTTIKTTLQQVKNLLDQWATTKAPASLAAYGVLAWEYTNPGQLSNPTGDPTLRGPTTAEQAAVPDAIKQARLNLYLVEHDASYGVHNGFYARVLLEVARSQVAAELAKP